MALKTWFPFMKNLKNNCTGTDDFGKKTLEEQFSEKSITKSNGYVNIKNIKGNSIVWNQLVNNVFPIRKTYNNTTSSAVYRESNLQLSSKSFRSTAHKVLLFLDYTLNNDNDISGSSYIYGYQANSSHIVTTANLKKPAGNYTYKAIWNMVSNSYIPTYQYFYCRIDSGDCLDITFNNFRCYDLTLMFGEGNEPTVEEFDAMFPLDYYEYNKGEIINFNGNGIKASNQEGTIEKLTYFSKNISEIMYNGEQLFPYGLCSAGDVCDEITETKAIKRIGRVDLGSLNWNKTTNSGGDFLFFTSTNFNLAKGSTSYCNVINTKGYHYVNAYATGTDKAIVIRSGNVGGIGISIHIRDLDFSTAEEFKSAMSGVYLYYELGTPIEVEFGSASINRCDVTGCDKIEMIPVNTSYVESSPLKLSLQYNTLSNSSGITNMANCIVFDGNYENVFDTGYGNGLSSRNKSISCFVNLQSSAGTPVIFGAENGTNQRFCVGLYNGKFNIGYGSTGMTRSSNSTADLNTWKLVCLTTDSSGVSKLYINGALTNEVLTSSSDFNLASNIFIGGNNSGSCSTCKINDFRIYDNCLSDYDINRIYAQKIYDLVPYSSNKNLLFDKSGLLLMPLNEENASYKGNALYFDGNANSRIRPKNGNIGFNMSGGTISIWFTVSAIPTTNRVLYIDSTSNFGVGFHNGGFLVSKKSSSNVFSTSNVKIGEVNNIVVGYTTTSTPKYCIVNGVPATQNDESIYWSESSGLTIGGRTYNNTSNFVGKIFNIEIFEKTLSSDEAIKLYEESNDKYIPEGYEQLEYIEGTGTQWIDTGIKATQDTKAEVKFKATDINGHFAVFGSRESSASCAFNIWTKMSSIQSKMGCNFGNLGAISFGTLCELNKTYKISIKNGEKTINGIRNIFTRASNFTTPGNVYLFNINGGNTTSSGTSNRIFVGKIYEFKMFENDMLVRNLIPAKRKSDNVIGMYDMVSKQFFTNSGTGSFTGA